MILFSHFPVFTIALAFAMVGAALLAFMRKWVALHFLTSHHEVAFPIFLQIGVIYAVLLAFTFSMVLDQLADSFRTTQTETTNLLTLAQLAPGFSTDMKKKVDANLLEYTKEVIYGEWPLMAKKQEDANISRLLDDLERLYLNYTPQNVREQIIYSNSLEHLANLRENRRIRIFTATEPKISSPLTLLSILGFIVIAISYFFGMHRLWAQMVLTGSLIFTISSILIIIYMLGNPFAGKFGLKPKVFKNAQVRLEQISRDF
ncbi:MAG: DUF4239 domain-containing protein [Proteobacteria bacterium]|nr:DUF4239 domain-containing protein [Pseudomonadota bacterium]